MIEERFKGAGSLSSRRGFSSFGLASLAALLNAHRVEAEPYVGAADQRPGDVRRDRQTPAPAMVVDVKDFGARGDGQTDDAPAINAAIHAVRERHRRVNGFDLGCRIVFPTAIYAVDASVDLTLLRNLNTVIDGSGSAILGRCQGKPVIDVLGARWLTMRDLTVLGDPTSVPDIGIQIGLLSTKVVADDHRFENVKILGNFLRACLYNRAAETTGFDHLLLWNAHPASFCLVQDGANHFGVNSSFAAVDMPTATRLSFNENVFTNCDFRHGAGGTPVWLAGTARHSFIRCYSATENGPSFVLDCGQNIHTMLDMDCHCETFGLRDIFLITGGTGHVALRGFSYRDHGCNASNSVFRCDDHVSYVELENARIEIATFTNQTCKVFDKPELWKATGSFYSSGAEHWNGDHIFTGMLTTGTEVRYSGRLAAQLQVEAIQRVAGQTIPGDGCLFRDKKTNKLMLWTGSGWVDALGKPA